MGGCRNTCLPAEEDRESEEGQFSQSGADTGKDHALKQRWKSSDTIQ